MVGSLSTNGAAHTSPGQRPGYASSLRQALKGRLNRCLAPSGLGMFLSIEPRALPWAGMNDALGVSALLSVRICAARANSLGPM